MNSLTHQAINSFGQRRLSLVKPPLPTLRARSLQQNSSNRHEIKIPPLVAGAITASFATTLAQGLNGELLTHYYMNMSDCGGIRINLDRVLDRLLADFARQLWDELWHFYSDANDSAHDDAARQVTLLFEGPICQLILVLNGPEISRCILDHIGPGLSQRPISWTGPAKGIDLQLGLQLLLGFWEQQYPSKSPRGSAVEIARTVNRFMTASDASARLASRIREVLLSPNYVQMHWAESAIWSMVCNRPRPPPRDGFHVGQFNMECQLASCLSRFDSVQSVNLASLPAVTGTASQNCCTTVLQYVERVWKRCGGLLVKTLEDATKAAAWSAYQGGRFYGMAVWDSGEDETTYCPGLQQLHVEIEEGFINLSVSAWTHTMIEIFQQMTWLCAALSTSPYPGILSESVVELASWRYLDQTLYVNCTLTHHPVQTGSGRLPWMREVDAGVIARGFPVTQMENA